MSEGPEKSKPLSPLSQDDALEGKEIADFCLQKVISKGASGLIFRARRKSDDCEVALKILRPNHLANRSYIKRFEQEISLLSKLNHPALITFVDSGYYHQLPYYAMEFIEGPDVEHCVRHRGRAPAFWAVRMVRVVAEGVAYLHRKGIIHRDITPRNILIQKETNRPVLTDLGVAKWVESMSESWDGVFRKPGSITQFGDVVGTPAYMSPEQLRPKSFRIGKRTDVYGLGALLYFALLGLPPFDASNLAELLRAIQEEEPLSLREVRASLPSELDRLALSCLSKDPQNRPGSAAQLARSLQALEADLLNEKDHPQWGTPWEPSPEDLTSQKDLEEGDFADSSSEDLVAVSGLIDANDEAIQEPKAFGSFQILEELDRDTTGILFRVRAQKRNRTYLLKRAHSARHTILERFRKESQILAGINHPNIISVVQAGEVDGIPWFTMDLASGDHLEHYFKEGRRPPTSKAVSIMKSVALAIDHIHNKGVLHCNLTPRSVYLTSDSVPKVTGFSSINIEGSVVGDPAYRPPEQTDGKPLGRTADVYALGNIFFEMLTGKALHDELGKGIPLSALIGEVSPHYKAILQQALSHNPEARFPTAEAFAKALDPNNKSTFRRISRGITNLFSRKKLLDEE